MSKEKKFNEFIDCGNYYKMKICDKNGNEKAIGPIMGMIMEKSKGKTNPKLTSSIIKDLIQELY